MTLEVAYATNFRVVCGFNMAWAGVLVTYAYFAERSREVWADPSS